MQFEKRNVMGIELDVLTGHPEHKRLFIVSQVARNTGLKDPANAVANYKASKRCNVAIQLASIVSLGNFQGDIPKAPNGRRYHDITTLMDETNVYRMLMRGNTKAAADFQTWIAEDVVPFIVETGKYDAEQSTNPIAQGVMDYIKVLEGKIDAQANKLDDMQQAHRLEVSELKGFIGEAIQGLSLSVASIPSPYEGQPPTNVSYHFNSYSKTTFEVLETQNVRRPEADKAVKLVVRALDALLFKQWGAEGGAKLDIWTSEGGIAWAQFPRKWLLDNLAKRTTHQQAVAVVLEKIKADALQQAFK